MKRVWNQELDNYLKTIYKNKSDQEITNLINDNFNTCFTKSAIDPFRLRPLAYGMVQKEQK